MRVREVTDDEREWVRLAVIESWGAEIVVGRGRTRRPAELPALVAIDDDGKRVGLATYDVERDAAELVTLNAFEDGKGIGPILVAAVVEAAKQAGARKVVVMTTNDNTKALRLYQRAGFRLVDLRPGAIEEARQVKPEIPETGNDGIPVRDEIDLELQL